MAQKVRPIPEGYSRITPFLVVNDAAKAIEFYRNAFGAEEVMRSASPDGKIMHCELQFGDARLALSDEYPFSSVKAPKNVGATTFTIQIYCEDVDTLYARALKAGAKVEMPLADMFWGDRYGQVIDPFGHHWALATRKENLTRDEQDRRAREFFASQRAKP